MIRSWALHHVEDCCNKNWCQDGREDIIQTICAELRKSITPKWWVKESEYCWLDLTAAKQLTRIFCSASRVQQLWFSMYIMHLLCSIYPPSCIFRSVSSTSMLACTSLGSHSYVTPIHTLSSLTAIHEPETSWLKDTPISQMILYKKDKFYFP